MIITKVTDWSGHIDALVGAGIIILAQVIFNVWLLKKIKFNKSTIE